MCEGLEIRSLLRVVVVMGICVSDRVFLVLLKAGARFSFLTPLVGVSGILCWLSVVKNILCTCI